jgi:hypothetical protein
MEKRKVMEGTFESSKKIMSKEHPEIIIKLPKIKVEKTKMKLKKIIKFLCF